jgi:CubicO group peptidase (beta-lactamase class C family)
VMRDSAAAGDMSSEGTFFWGGAAGTQFWIDPKEDMVVVAMIQHMATPEADATWSQLHTLVYSALLE